VFLSKGKELIQKMADNIAEKLIALRGKKSREEVAKALGLSISAISMYENGERIPRDSIKIKIANYYNKSVQEIFFN
jgi:transcriptional regulator with XRE-family HTH domain